MALFDDIGKKFNDVGQMTKDIAGIAKYNSMITDEEHRARELYEKIGRKYVADLSGNATGEMKVWVDEVRSTEEKISSYRETVQSLKGIAVCPNCGSQVDAENPFCPNCGAKMPETVKDDRAFCPHCGAKVAKESIFCTSCGKKILNEAEGETSV